MFPSLSTPFNCTFSQCLSTDIGKETLLEHIANARKLLRVVESTLLYDKNVKIRLIPTDVLENQAITCKY